VSQDISINLNEITNDGANEANFRVISYTCVKAATNNFSLENSQAWRRRLWTYL